MNPKQTSSPRNGGTTRSSAPAGASPFNPPPLGVETPPVGMAEPMVEATGGMDENLAPAPTGTAHQVVEQAHRLTDAVRRRAVATSEEKKSVLATHVGTLVEKLDGAARPAEGSERGIDEQLIERGVGLLRRFQKALDENSTRDLLGKAEAQIKARPGLFMAGFLALGFLGARLVRK